MGNEQPPAPLPINRLIGVGAVVFFANAALLVLQLVASKLLAPFVGSDLYTWTSVIGVFLAGIALGNAMGGRIADRYPTPRTLTILLVLGAASALWMAAAPQVFHAGGLYKSIPLGPRIPILSLVLCLPAGFVLSLLTPVSIKLGLADVSRTGRVAGMVFALSTLGCLLGNYVTGFYLIPALTINTLVLAAAGTLGLLAVGSLALARTPLATAEAPVPVVASEKAPPLVPTPADSPAPTDNTPAINPHAFRDIRLAYLIVFLCSFCGMALELTASRIIARGLGVSLYTWTGVIGVMLAGTAIGNFLGGIIADRVNRPGSTADPRRILAGTILYGGAASVFIFISLAVVSNVWPSGSMDLIDQVLIWTFAVFFAPMLILGMVSPQVIRLAVPDVAHVGRVAGRVYAWSTGGAIVGTFATGYVLISALGINQTILLLTLVLAATTILISRVWETNHLVYVLSIVLGGVTGGFILTNRASTTPGEIATLETNYYTIRVTEQEEMTEDGQTTYRYRSLHLDHLLHSVVRMDDPMYLYYPHEYAQLEFLRDARTRTNQPRALVIGGGGYTFPRCVMEVLPETHMDVVEIDPGVTQVARQHLGLKDYPNLHAHHRDGRQFVAEVAEPASYDLVVQDAVNDLSVPGHLLTKEYNDAVKAILKPGGVYLLTVIDSIKYGRIWRSSMRTLRETFAHVTLVLPTQIPAYNRQLVPNRAVYVIYASDRPFDLSALWTTVVPVVFPAFKDEVWPPQGQGWPAAMVPPFAAVLSGVAVSGSGPFRIHEVPPRRLRRYFEADPGVLLTDQYAPVDNLMAEVFRARNIRRLDEDEPDD